MARTELTGRQIKDKTVSLVDDVVGVLPVANGGTGSDTLPLNNLLVGNGTGALQAIAPGSTGAVLSSNGSSWSANTLAISDVSGLDTTLDAITGNLLNKEDAANKGTADGYASLDSSAKVPVAQMNLTGLTLVRPTTDNLTVGVSNNLKNGGTTVLTSASNQIQLFTGSSNHTVKLDNSLPLGAQFFISNRTSTGTITITSNDGQTITTVPVSSEIRVTCLQSSPTLTGHFYASPYWKIITKTDLGLDQVDNTSDVTKNAATATLTNKTIVSPTVYTANISDSTLTNATITGSNFDALAVLADVTATTGSTTYLSDGSYGTQVFTGTQTQTVEIDGTACKNGLTFTIANQSTQTVSVVLNTGTSTTALVSVPTLSEVVVQAVEANPTTTAGWRVSPALRTLNNVDNTSDATKNAAVATLTNKTLTTPVLNGTVTGTGVDTANTASTLVQRNASGDFTAGVVTGSRFVSTVATGTAPFTVSSTTRVNNLTAQFIDSYPASISAGASTLAVRDSNTNITAGNFFTGFNTNVTASGTATLVAGSKEIQEFTGSTAGQIVKLPTTAIAAGTRYTIINSSSVNITVQSSNGNTAYAITAGYSATFTALIGTPQAAADWRVTPSAPFSTTGTANTVALRDSSGNVTAVQLVSNAPNGTAPLTVTSSTLVTNLNANYLNGYTPSAGTGVNQIALRDGVGNLLADRFVATKESIATAAATTNLAIGNAATVEFTGTTTQTVLLPTTSITMGTTQTIVNNSTGILTIQTSSASFMAYMNPGDILVFYALQDTPTTNAHWRTLAPAGIQPVFTITGNQTVSMYHGGTLCVMDNSAAATITIPTNASIAFPIGTSIDFVQKNTGSVTFAAANSGTTTITGYPGLKLAGQWCGASLRKIGTDAWVAVGALSA